MAIACPYCSHRLNLKAGKPGRYRPKCPNCAQPFVLWVEADGTVKARALPSDTRAGGGPVAVAPDAPEPLGASHVFGFAQTNPDADPNHRSPGPEADSGDQDDAVAIAPRTDVRGYAIERELGRGGMGTVYLARQLSLDRPVALKVMSKRWVADPVFVARFTREAFAAAQLSHPNIRLVAQ
ncbi:MAG: hypothetical protein FJ304_09775 [Planctomycetes bacterium]|nr:hypothetical protein [Planctomycetota bacterium]